MTSADDREKSFLLLSAAFVISIVLHIGLVMALSSCSISTFSDELKAAHKASKDVPEMRVTRFDRDPVAPTDDARGRPERAPVEEDVTKRVERLEDAADRPLVAAPELARASKGLAPAGPVPENSLALAPAAQLVSAPQAPVDDAQPLRVFGDLHVAPALDVPETLAASKRLTHTTAVPEEGFKPSPLALPTAPSADLVPSGSSLAVSLPGIGSGVLGGTGSGTGVSPRPAPPAAPTEVMKQVDEQVIAREKEAVRGLRDDTGDAKLPDFSRHVRLSLFYHPNGDGTKSFRVRMVSNLVDPLPPIDKDVIYLMDVSGSIGKDRLKSCSLALKQVLRDLGSGDRFEIVTFRDRFTHCFSAWRAVDEPALAQADDFLDHQMNRGNTDVFGMIRQVLTMPRDATRPVVAVFVTDAEATTGLTRSTEILSAFSKLNGGLISIYMYGVKDTSKVELMRAVSDGARGAWFRHEGNRSECARRFSGFNARFAEPLLTDIVVAYAASSRVSDPTPRFPRNLYTGDAVELRGVCPAAQRELVFSMRGLSGDRPMESFFKLEFAKAVRE